jgi:hypothetical protein
MRHMDAENDHTPPSFLYFSCMKRVLMYVLFIPAAALMCCIVREFQSWNRQKCVAVRFTHAKTFFCTKFDMKTKQNSAFREHGSKRSMVIKQRICLALHNSHLIPTTEFAIRKRQIFCCVYKNMLKEKEQQNVCQGHAYKRRQNKWTCNCVNNTLYHRMRNKNN